MEDFMVLATGRTIIELSAQREQLQQLVKQLQSQVEDLRKQIPVKES